MARFAGPEALRAGHELGGFDCGAASLSLWLHERARGAAGAGSPRTYVVTDSEQARVVGYHALTVASIEHYRATSRAARGMPAHPIPAVLLARLAVDRSVQRRGIGAWLLRDAMLRTVSASEALGIRAMLVHALDETARGFYLRREFEPSPTDPLNLQIIVQDIRAALSIIPDAYEKP
jgi:GNAT superfamily N-acetyltransferase